MRASLATVGILWSLGMVACGRSELDLGGDTGKGAGGLPGAATGGVGQPPPGAAGSGGGAGGKDGGPLDSVQRDATEAGSAGPGRTLYTPCSTLGALDCSSQNPRIRLLCDGMTWSPIAVCPVGFVCDTQPGDNHGLCIGSDAGTLVDGGGGSPDGASAGTGVVLYTPCSTLGALSCSIANPKVQVLCDGMTWNPIGTCPGQQVCDLAPGPNQGFCK